MNFEDEISIKDILDVAADGKIFIIFFSFLVFVASAAVLFSMPDKYESKVLLVPSDSFSSGGLSLPSGLGGLAAMAGMSLGDPVNDKVTTALEILKSRKFISNFIVKNQLEQNLLAAKRWDEDTNKIILNEAKFDSKKKQWLDEKEPSIRLIDAYDEFSDLLSVYRDEKTGVVEVTITYYSPYLAKDWLQALILQLNETIKLQDVTEANKSMKFLEEQLEKVSVGDMQDVFYELIEQQMKIVLLANVREEYVLKTIDPAVVIEKSVGPSKLLILIISFFVGTAVAMLILMLKKMIQIN